MIGKGFSTSCGQVSYVIGQIHELSLIASKAVGVNIVRDNLRGHSVSSGMDGATSTPPLTFDSKQLHFTSPGAQHESKILCCREDLEVSPPRQVLQKPSLGLSHN